MRLRILKRSSLPLVFICLLLAATGRASAQTVTAVPHLDLDRFVGKWYEVARYPTKLEKKCLGNVFQLIARGEKRQHLDLVSSCAIGDGFAYVRNGTIKAENKTGDGKLKVSYLWPFSTRYWVLALGPDEGWSLVGSPNHKNLWVLSRTATLKPDVLADIRSKAAAQGFPPDKLLLTPQTATVIDSKDSPPRNLP